MCLQQPRSAQRFYSEADARGRSTQTPGHAVSRVEQGGVEERGVERGCVGGLLTRRCSDVSCERRDVG